MQFVNPAFLFGLFGIAIPVIIHLFNFRRYRKEYFTNVRFIQQLKQETRKRSRLRHLIILAMRILAIASLAFAFAQPYIPFKPGQAPIAARNAVSIFVDNSFSMEAVGSSGTLLDEAVRKAREIVAAYKASDNFQLLTNDFEGRQQRFITREEFLTQLDEIKPSPVSRSMGEILSRQADMLESSPASRHVSFILSDFQRSAFGNFPKPDSSLHVFLVPLAANNQSNVYIDTCWFDMPLQQAGNTATLNARIWNRSKEDLEKIPVKLEVMGQQRAVAGIDLKAGTSAVIRLPFTNKEPGIQWGTLQLTDYPVTYDDRFYFSYEVTSSLNVLAINGKEENRFVNALFEKDSSIVLTNIPERAIDYSKIQSYNLILLNELTGISSGLAQELRRFLEQGGTLAFIPSTTPDLTSYNTFLGGLKCPQYMPLDTSNNKVVRINTESPLYRDVFEKSAGGMITENTELPVVSRYFPIRPISGMQSQSQLSMLNGRDFLTLTKSMQGQVLQFAVPFDASFSNFPRQALFVPTLYNIALVSRPPLRLYYTAGRNEAIRVSHPELGDEEMISLCSQDGRFRIIPEQHRGGTSSTLFTNNEVKLAGNYLLQSGNDTLSGVSFNFDRGESNLECMSADELEKQISQARWPDMQILKTKQRPVNEVLEQMNYGTRLWKYFLWAALAFLLAEVVLLRLWKY